MTSTIKQFLLVSSIYLLAPASNATTLNSAAPGENNLDESLLSGMSSVEEVQSAFTELGVENSTIQQVTPLVSGLLDDK